MARYAARANRQIILKGQKRRVSRRMETPVFFICRISVKKAVFLFQKVYFREQKVEVEKNQKKALIFAFNVR